MNAGLRNIQILDNASNVPKAQAHFDIERSKQNKITLIVPFIHWNKSFSNIPRRIPTIGAEPCTFCKARHISRSQWYNRGIHKKSASCVKGALECTLYPTDSVTLTLSSCTLNCMLTNLLALITMITRSEPSFCEGPYDAPKQ